MKQRLHITPM